MERGKELKLSCLVSHGKYEIGNEKKNKIG